MDDAANERADLGILLVGATRAFTDLLHDELDRRGFADVRPAFGVVLRALRDEELRLTRLAERLGVSKQAAAKVVDEMVTKGLVSREPSPTDGRAVQLALTARGRSVVAVAAEIGQDLERRLTSRVGSDDVEAMARALAAFVELGGGAEDLAVRRSKAVWW